MIEFLDSRQSRSLKPGQFLLKTQLELAAPLESVFGFFSDAFNLEKITPPWVQFRILTPPPIELRVGALIDYHLRIHGIRIGWRTEITEWEPPQRFTDRQLHGPYKLWNHTHEFESTANGTIMRDRVHYAVYGGWVVERLLVRNDIRKIFVYRNQQIAAHFQLVGLR